MVMAAGGDVQVPEYDTELARFEELLDEVPPILDQAAHAQQAVRLALGLSAIPERA